MYIVFFGTHNLATTILKTLIDAPDFEITAVVTQPDKPAGRDKNMQSTPVKELAEQNNLPIFQFSTLTASDTSSSNKIVSNNFVAPATQLSKLGADLFVVAEYGMLIPKTILDMSKHGTLNVHPSLLPKYRGASPIQSAILNGEKETGVTIMLLDEKMDHGPILKQQNCSIRDDETAPELEKKLAECGAELLIKTISDWIAGKIQAKEQNHNKATFCKKISREDGKIDWNLPAEKIYNHWRAFQPWPGVYTEWNGKRLKLPHINTSTHQHINTLEPGNVYLDQNGRLTLACGVNSLNINRLQLEGKKEIDAVAFINGHKNFVGSQL